ncbi:MAG: type II toxin-antitoxin system VapC family toxin [Maricaulaceae bacterium]
MSVVLVDSNVLLDIFTEAPIWLAWSQDALARAAETSKLAINAIIYAEISVRFSRIEALDEVLTPRDFVREPIPFAAAFLAAKAFAQYRKRGGVRTAPLPDFLIGAHAVVSGYPLLTRDVARYRTYFPTLDLIAPERTAP